MIPENEIGANLRRMRTSLGLSLDALAQKTGLSKGYLSKVETSDKAPPVSTLLMIVKSLGVTISEVFGEGQEKVTAAVVTKAERKPVARDGTVFGYSYETLAHKYPGKRMEPYLLTIPGDSVESAVFQHQGEEMMIMLEGIMHFRHGSEEFIMHPGDCIYFDSGIEHYGLPMNGQDVKVLMVIYLPE